MLLKGQLRTSGDVWGKKAPPKLGQSQNLHSPPLPALPAEQALGPYQACPEPVGLLVHNPQVNC